MPNHDSRILVTGAAGFIGMHLCKSLLENNFHIFGIDNLNDYYDPNLKRARLDQLTKYENFTFLKSDIVDMDALDDIFKSFKPNKVVNLAAQAGVRYSLENPHVYVQANVVGFMNILECCRHHDISGLIYASSSSVYGGNKKYPFSENDSVVQPISIYAATKKANELMAHTYSHLYGLNTTGLRFFTVYGPWGRPDMAMYIFASKISAGEAIPVFNYGRMQRDFTYIDDTIQGVRAAMEKNYSCEIFNLGNNRSEDLLEMIRIIEENIGQKADMDFQGMQPGDVEKTFADIDHSWELMGYQPTIPISVGIPKFINWFREYNK